MSKCNVPHIGWTCTRAEGHEGPCAALEIPMTGWVSPSLGRAYDLVGRVRDALAQNTESGIDQALRNALLAIETADCELEAIS